MGIKEKDLQTVQSIEGGKLRCVTANGESRNVPADAVCGGNAFVVTISQQEFGGTATADKTYAEIKEAFQQGKDVRGILNMADSMYVYEMAMELASGVIQGFFIEPYFENSAVSKFIVIAVSIISSGSIEINRYEKL